MQVKSLTKYILIVYAFAYTIHYKYVLMFSLNGRLIECIIALHISALDQTKPYFQSSSCWLFNNLGSIIMENITKDASPNSINSEQPYRTWYHFQPLKNWMNGRVLSKASLSIYFLHICKYVISNSLMYYLTCFADQNWKPSSSSCRS